MIDEIAATPMELRQEIRRLHDEIARSQALLPANLRGDGIEMRSIALSVMSRHLCPLRYAPEGTACACTGACSHHAEEIMRDLEAEGFMVIRR